VLSGFDPEFAVRGFFVASGYLVAGSALRARSLMGYWRNRALRIFPAYWAALILGILLAVASVRSEGLGGFGLGKIVKYLSANFLFLNFLVPSIAPAFNHNVYQAINGSLWTIKIEIGFYIIAPFLVRLFSSRRPKVWLALIYLLSVCYLTVMEWMYTNTGRDSFLFLSRQLPGQLSYFAAGMAWHLVSDRRLASLARIFFTCSALFLVALFVPLVSAWIMPAAVGGIIISLAFWPSRVSRLDDFGDLSYGVYVYHFPILQTLVSIGAFATGARVYWGAGLGAVLVFALAAMSWFWLERPMLKKKGAKSAATPMTQSSGVGR